MKIPSRKLLSLYYFLCKGRKILNLSPTEELRRLNFILENTFKRWSLTLRMGVHKIMERNEMSKLYMNGMG